MIILDNERLLVRLSDECRLRNYSKKTISNYVYHVAKFLCWLGSKNLKKSVVKDYILSLSKKNYSQSTIRQIRAALAFFFENVLKRDYMSDALPPMKRKKTLPKVLSKDEIEKFISSLKNLKHRLIVSLLYSSGLRVSEVVNLKSSDIDTRRNTILVRQGKGKKDRFTILSENVKKDLLDYLCQRNSASDYRELEEELLVQLNQLGIGPQGLGGRLTALAVNIESYPTHIAGLPVVVNLNCHISRHREVLLASREAE